MRPLSEATARITGKSFGRKYIALGRIVNAWPEIVGAALASKAQPTRLQYRKREKSKTPEAVLEIAASSADATLLHYQKDLILERINQIFGERWITAIRFMNTPANTPPLKRRKRKRPLTAAEKNTLSGMLEYVSDDELQIRLENLGQEIFMDAET